MRTEHGITYNTASYCANTADEPRIRLDSYSTLHQMIQQMQEWNLLDATASTEPVAWSSVVQTTGHIRFVVRTV
jgi:hypothetical protein